MADLRWHRHCRTVGRAAQWVATQHCERGSCRSLCWHCGPLHDSGRPHGGVQGRLDVISLRCSKPPGKNVEPLGRLLLLLGAVLGRLEAFLGVAGRLKAPEALKGDSDKINLAASEAKENRKGGNDLSDGRTFSRRPA
eukprot:1334101-Pyramimonas_sp.AAC.1